MGKGQRCVCGHQEHSHAKRKKNPGRGRCGSYLCTCREYRSAENQGGESSTLAERLFPPRKREEVEADVKQLAADVSGLARSMGALQKPVVHDAALGPECGCPECLTLLAVVTGRTVEELEALAPKERREAFAAACEVVHYAVTYEVGALVTACGKKALGWRHRPMRVTDEPGDVTCRACIAVAAPPSRSEAEARPPATVEAPEVDPVGSLSDGLASLPKDARPCCPDAGDWRCHGQAPGTCGCCACGRADRRSLTHWVRELRKFVKRVPATEADKKFARRDLAAVVRTLRGRARAEMERAERLEARVARAESLNGRLVAQVEKLDADYLAEVSEVSTLMGEGTAARKERDAALARVAAVERERDDALMQASAAAERAHRAEKELEELRALGRFFAEEGES